jgi:hypothetical protein
MPAAWPDDRDRPGIADDRRDVVVAVLSAD